ncbi:unnamed protein product [Calypogeia fissa]
MFSASGLLQRSSKWVGGVAFWSESSLTRRRTASFSVPLSRDIHSFCRTPTRSSSSLLLLKEVFIKDCSQHRNSLKLSNYALNKVESEVCSLGPKPSRGCASGFVTTADFGVELLQNPTLKVESEFCFLGQKPSRRRASGFFTIEESVELFRNPSQGSLLFELEKLNYTMDPARLSSLSTVAAEEAAGAEVTESATELATRFWMGSQKEAYSALYHPFVVALAGGALHISAFQRYIGQDIYFLAAFAEAYGLAIESTDDREAKSVLQGLKLGVQDELNQVHSSVVSLGEAVTAIQPNAATSAYTDFLLKVARGNDDNGSDLELNTGVGANDNETAALLRRRSRAAHTIAAMTPCNKLYAFLGQEIKKALKGDTSSSAYAQWIDTYASSEFHSTAIRSEQLVHGLAMPFPGEIDVAAMERLYRRAMELEVGFFSAQEQPPLSTNGRPTLVPLFLTGLASNSHFILISDFDSTCTVSDSCPVLADLSVATRDREVTSKGVAISSSESAESLRNRWDSLVVLYAKEYTELLDRLLSDKELSSRGAHQERGYNAGNARKILEALAEFEITANKRVVDSKVLSGLSIEDVRQAGGSIPLREGCLDLLKRISGDTLAIDFHILSVCWSQSIIEGSFSGNGLQFGNVHSNELEFNDMGISTGNMFRRVQNAVDKEICFKDVVNGTNKKLEGTSSPKSPFTVYVGDSVTDLLCLLMADVGIVVGESSSLQRVVEAAGITILPLYSGLLQQQEAATTQVNTWTKVDGVLYKISSWHELHAFLLGS